MMNLGGNVLWPLEVIITVARVTLELFVHCVDERTLLSLLQLTVHSDHALANRISSDILDVSLDLDTIKSTSLLTDFTINLYNKTHSDDGFKWSVCTYSYSLQVCTASDERPRCY